MENEFKTKCYQAYQFIINKFEAANEDIDKPNFEEEIASILNAPEVDIIALKEGKERPSQAIINGMKSYFTYDPAVNEEIEFNLLEPFYLNNSLGE